MDSANDSVSYVSFDTQTEVSARLGMRLEGKFKSAGVHLQPYVTTDFWSGNGGRDTQTYDHVDKVKTDYNYTSLNVGTGLVAQLNKNLSVHAGIDYTANLDSRQQKHVGANLGLRLSY